MASSYDTTKLTNLAALKSLAEKIKEGYAKQSDFTALQTKVNAIKVPTKVGELTNDKKYQTDSDVSTAIQTAISKTGHASFKAVTALPEATAAEDNVLYLYKNAESGYYDIYAKVTEDGSAKLLRIDDTTVDLSAYSTTAQIEAAYVKKDGSKVLSTNDYTSAEKTKLAGITTGATKVAKSTTNGNILINDAQTVVYTHPTSAAGAKASGLYKITTDAAGHVTAATAVAKTDITTLGIPGSDTTYNDATQSLHGLMSTTDKKKLDGMVIADTSDITSMLEEVFGE